MTNAIKAFGALLAKEALIWCTLPSVFLYVYVIKYHFDKPSALSHLTFIAVIAVSVVTLKALLFNTLKSKRDAVLVSALIYGTFFYILLTYYALVIMSLASWGKVITSELITSYIVHAAQFCQSIELSFSLVVIVNIVGFLLLIVLFYFIHTRFFKNNHPVKTPIKVNRHLVSLMLFTVFLLSYNQLLERFLSPDLTSHEPINLTLYSGKSNLDTRFYPKELPYNLDYNEQEKLAISEYQPNPKANKLNVILIFVDALRLKNMQVYGYSRETTPYLSNIHEKGQLIAIENAYASCPETSCALSSFLTARFPHKLPENAFTFIDVLKKHGYKTIMNLGGDHTNFYSLRDLYGDIDDFYDGSMEKKYFFNDDDLVTHQASHLPIWNMQPTFMQFHLMSAHTLGKHHETFKKYAPSKSYAGYLQGPVKQNHINHYDNGVLQADNYIKTLLTILKEKQYLKNSIVVITADHGELLGEHGLYTHANGVWEDLLHIPLLIIKSTGQNTIDIPNDKLVSQVDIAPTVLEALNMPVPKSWIGKKLKSESTNNYIYFRWPPQSGLYDQSVTGKTMKYWLNYNTNEEFIFNISQDPKEENNLVWNPELKAKKKMWREMLNKDQSLKAIAREG